MFEAVNLFKNVVVKDLRSCVDFMVLSIKFNPFSFLDPRIDKLAFHSFLLKTMFQWLAVCTVHLINRQVQT